MANTYTQMYVQIVFAVWGRARPTEQHQSFRQANVITEIHRNELEKYICGIISNNKCKPLSLYCNPDHIHILVGLHPTVSVFDLTRDIKSSSSKFINQKKWMAGKFNWQDGFGSFTYSNSQIDDVAKYILNQPVHHKKRSFREEIWISFEKMR